MVVNEYDPVRSTEIDSNSSSPGQKKSLDAVAGNSIEVVN